LMFAMEASMAAPAIARRCANLLLIPTIKHKFSSAIGTELLPSLD
jgi:hypothetical protein